MRKSNACELALFSGTRLCKTSTVFKTVEATKEDIALIEAKRWKRLESSIWWDSFKTECKESKAGAQELAQSAE